MSSMETHIGRLVQLNFSGDPNLFLISRGIDINDGIPYDNYILYDDETRNCKYIITKSKKLFVIEDHELSEDDDSINEIIKVNKDQYNYVFRFYNGGTYYEEVLTEQLNKIEF